MSDLNVGPVAVTSGTAKLNSGGLNIGDQITTDTSGSITFSAQGARIRGDFSNGTASKRVLFQSTSGISSIGALAADANAGSSFVSYSSQDPDNSTLLRLASNINSGSTVYSIQSGTGALMPLSFGVGNIEGFRVAPNTGNTLFGATTDNFAAKVQISGGLHVASGNTYLPTDASLSWGFTTGAWTGFYSPSSAYLMCRVNGNEVWRGSSTGNMLVGTSSDNGSDKLQVAGNIYTTGTFRATYLEVVGSGGYLGYGVYWNGTAWISRAAGKGAIIRNDPTGILSFQFFNAGSAGAVVTPNTPISMDLNTGTVNATSFAATGAASSNSLTVAGNATVGGHLDVSGAFPQIRAIGNNNTTGGITVVDSNNKSYSFCIGTTTGTDGIGSIYNGATGTHPITWGQDDLVTLSGGFRVPGTSVMGVVKSGNLDLGNNGGIYNTSQDGSSNTLANVAIKSWYGIGLQSTCGCAVPANQFSHWFDTRTGNSGQQGRNVAWGGYTSLNGSDINIQASSANPNSMGGLIWSEGTAGSEQHRIWDDLTGDGTLTYRYRAGQGYRLLHSGNGVHTPAGLAIDISNQDLNNVVKTGFYRGVSIINAPSTDWYYVTVINHDVNWCMQEAIKYSDSTKFRRIKVDGSWGAWVKDFMETSGTLKGTLLVAPYATGGTNYSVSLFGFGASASPADQLFKIATLPVDSVGSRDHIVIEGVFDDTWLSGQKASYEILMSNRGGFTWNYRRYGDVHSQSVIYAYKEADGSVSVWAGTLGTSFSSLNLNIKLSFGAAVYKDPIAGTPTGTLVFNSADNSAYPAQISNSLGGERTFMVQRDAAPTQTWGGRMGIINAAADRSTFLGNWNGLSVVASHNAGFSNWAPIYVNTLGKGTGGGDVYLSYNAYVCGTTDNFPILHTNNFANYTADLTGGVAIDRSGTDLNTLSKAGFYRGNAFGNAPNPGWFWITVQGHDNKGTADGWVSQTATSYGSGNAGNRIFTRVKAGPSWTAWDEVLTSHGGQTINGTTYIKSTLQLINDTDNTTYTNLDFQTTAGATHLFLNGPSRSGDGGPNTFTMRNDVGALRLMSGSDEVDIGGGKVFSSVPITVSGAWPQLTAQGSGSQTGGISLSNSSGKSFGIGIGAYAGNDEYFSIYNWNTNSIVLTIDQGNLASFITEVEVGRGQAGEKRLRLSNAADRCYFYLNDGADVGLYSPGIGYRWITSKDGNFTAHGSITAATSLNAANCYVGTSASGPVYVGTKSGSSYRDGTAVFRAVLDNPNGAASYLFEGFCGGDGGTRTFWTRADGLMYAAAGATLGSGVGGLYIGPYTGSSCGAIYAGAVTPNDSNYALLANGDMTIVNAPSNVIRFRVGNVEYGTLGASGYTQNGFIHANGKVVGVISGLADTATTDGSSQLLASDGGSGNAAKIGLVREGKYGINIGLDSDNVFRVGGWSDGASYRFQADTSGNFTARGNITVGSRLYVPFLGQASQALQVGATSDFGGNSFEVGIALPSGATHWPLGITKSGSVLFGVDSDGGIVASGNVTAGGGIAASGNVTAGGSLSATGSVNAGSGATGLNLRSYTAGGWGAIYSGAVTPSDTNYSLLVNSTGTILNAPPSSSVSLRVGGSTEYLNISTSGISLRGNTTILGSATVSGSATATGQMYVEGGSRVWADAYCTSYLNSSAQYGWQKLANGFVLMWRSGLTIPAGDGNTSTFTWPYIFPTRVFTAWTGTTLGSDVVGVLTLTTSGGTIKHGQQSWASTGVTVFGIGY